MKTLHTRVCIYPKDAQRINGKSERYCRILLQKIKEYFKKEEHQFLTVDEFSIYIGIKADQVNNFLSN